MPWTGVDVLPFRSISTRMPHSSHFCLLYLSMVSPLLRRHTSVTALLGECILAVNAGAQVVDFLSDHVLEFPAPGGDVVDACRVWFVTSENVLPVPQGGQDCSDFTVIE